MRDIIEVCAYVLMGAFVVPIVAAIGVAGSNWVVLGINQLDEWTIPTFALTVVLGIRAVWLQHRRPDTEDNHDKIMMFYCGCLFEAGLMIAELWIR